MSTKRPKLLSPPSTPTTHHHRFDLIENTNNTRLKSHICKDSDISVLSLQTRVDHDDNNNNFQNESRRDLNITTFTLRKLVHPTRDDEQAPPLIPGLPDDIAQLCLSKLPPLTLFSVCLSWRKFIYSPLFPPFLSLYAILTPNNPNPNHDFPPISIRFANFDPISTHWQWLPPLPDPPPDLLIRHPSFISRILPVQCVATANRLCVVAATDRNFLPVLNRPLVFDPVRSGWRVGPAMPVPRRWCAAGSVGGTVYIAGGVGTQFSRDTSRLVEKWDITRAGDGAWERVRQLKDGKFCREAVDAVGWKGKLCMVNVDAKEGVVYDTRRGEWSEMTAGMVAGWTGPAAAMEEEVVYLVDRSKGVLRRYDEGGDLWVDVFECDRLRGAQQMAASGGKICVVSGDGGEILVVDVVAPARMWVVDPPTGFNVVAVHVLPIMSKTDNTPIL